MVEFNFAALFQHLDFHFTFLGAPPPGANVILYGAETYLFYDTDELPINSVPSEFTFKIVEANFHTLPGLGATRQEIMRVLQNLTALYIKASYAEKGRITS